MRNPSLRFLADLVLIAVTGATVLLLGWADDWGVSGWFPGTVTCHVVVAACAVAAVLIRRRLPAVAVVVAAGLAAAEPLTGGALAVVACTVGLRGSGRWSRIALPAACLVVPTTATLLVLAGDPGPVLRYEVMIALVTGIVCGVLPALAGALAGQRERLVVALRERNAFLERAHHWAEEQARSRERARIAGEMHDLLGHRLSLVALHSGGLEMAGAAGDQEIHRSAVLVHSAAREAMHELRDVLGMLRAADPHTGTSEPLTAITGTRADVTALVAETRAAGIAVGLDWTGEDLTDVAPSARRAVHRVILEALTNVHKHASGSVVDVIVRSTPRRVRVDVINGPEPLGRSTPRLPGGDLGLVGLDERLRLLGGRLRAGPAEGGGYVVSAWIPLDVGPVGPPVGLPLGPEPVTAPRTWGNRVGVAAAVGFGAVAAVVLQFVTLAFVPYPADAGLPDSGLSEVPYEDFVREFGPTDPLARIAVRDREPVRPDAATTCDYHRGAVEASAETVSVHRYCFSTDRLVQEVEIVVDRPTQ